MLVDLGGDKGSVVLVVGCGARGGTGESVGQGGVLLDLEGGEKGH